MPKVLVKKTIAPKINLIELHAPLIAAKALPGQFIVLRIDDNGERIPLTIAKKDIQKGTITIIFQEAGASTKHLSCLKEGDDILDLTGPLGKAADIEKFGTVVCIGGGVGTPEVYPVAEAYKKAGNKVITIIGGRNKDLVLFEDELRAASDEVYIMTDDGSAGKKGLVTDALKEIIGRETVNLVSAVGPTIMMKVISELTKIHSIPTLVSLNPIMLDATGMCGVCRVTVGGKIKFACVDGPEFDGHQVDFAELMSRQKTFVDEEKIALNEFMKKNCSDDNPNCRCK